MSRDDIDMKEEARAELARIADENDGRLTPEVVLDHAADPDNPLHRYFEWSDRKAAQQYRLDQARELIRSVKIKVTINDRTETVRGYLRDRGQRSDHQGYIETVRLKTREDEARDAIIDEMKAIGRRLDRVRTLAAFFNAEDQVEEMARELEIMTTRMVEAHA